ncbi:homoserine dehydrogenase [Aquipuribacter nitratireducens]|uniref:Homoserine dehydrogenase n=1 Tax=Aquipuribacter nitratireducens TaxID=650104 RepID=A0ABW0GM21_9MICO
MEPVRVALLGCGVVGSEVARLLREQHDDLAARVGAPLELVGIAVRRPERERPGVDPSLLTADAEDLVRRADVVVEVVGGIEPVRSLLHEAFRHGAGVVTANKMLLAEHGPELFEAARAADVDLYYEAAVAGAIPLIRPLRESLAGDRVRRFLGIVNGTTNYVLDQMDTTGAGFADAVERAQALGYAEADPTADVEGYDAASKAAILASLAFHTRVPGDAVHREGITGVTAADVAAAARLGCVVKLLAIGERVPAGADGGPEGVTVRVHPAFVPRSHPLAGVRGPFNAVFVEAEAAGELMFYGPGAGGTPTAGAVLGDVVAVARHRVHGGRGPGESAYADLPALPMSRVLTRYHVRLEVADRPGVLARVADAFAAHGVSIEQVRQQAVGEGPDRTAELVVVTHVAPDTSLSETVEDLAHLDAVLDVTSVMRVEGE